VTYYATTNVAIGFTNADYALNTNYVFSTTIPNYATRSYVNPSAASYIGSVVITNKVLQLNSGVTVNAYLEMTGGGTAAASVHPEIYISYDGTNWIGDWASAPQVLTKAVTNLYSWVVANPNYSTTNASGFYVQRRFKVDTQAGNPTIVLHIGGSYPSHITLSLADATSGNAYLAANQTWTGSNTFSGGVSGNFNGATNLNPQAFNTNAIIFKSTNGVSGYLLPVTSVNGTNLFMLLVYTNGY
jgi:hypothetical protein